MSVKVQKVTDPLVLGEGPHWDARSQALYLVDIQSHTIHKYVPGTGQHTKTKLDGKPGFIVPVEGAADQFVVGVGRRFLVLRWDGREGAPVEVVRELAEVDRGTSNRLNDGKADPRGRLFAGTMGHEDPPGTFEQGKGALYRLDGAGGGGGGGGGGGATATATRLADSIGISNGLAWDLAQRAFYYIDSVERKIRRYDYDAETGEISNQKHIFDLKKNYIEGFPDGCTIDTEGRLWVAVFGGSCVLKVDPRTGELLQKVDIPAKQVTSATFGGPQLDILFVTTASMTIEEEQAPPCGCTFMVTGLGAKGHPNVNVKL